jgi:hypothetical protein
VPGFAVLFEAHLFGFAVRVEAEHRRGWAECSGRVADPLGFADITMTEGAPCALCRGWVPRTHEFEVVASVMKAGIPPYRSLRSLVGMTSRFLLILIV